MDTTDSIELQHLYLNRDFLLIIDRILTNLDRFNDRMNDRLNDRYHSNEYSDNRRRNNRRWSRNRNNNHRYWRNDYESNRSTFDTTRTNRFRPQTSIFNRPSFIGSIGPRPRTSPLFPPRVNENITPPINSTDFTTNTRLPGNNIRIPTTTQTTNNLWNRFNATTNTTDPFATFINNTLYTPSRSDFPTYNQVINSTSESVFSELEDTNDQTFCTISQENFVESDVVLKINRKILKKIY